MLFGSGPLPSGNVVLCQGFCLHFFFAVGHPKYATTDEMTTHGMTDEKGVSEYFKMGEMINEK